MRRGRKRKKYSEINVVDLFCGIGGLSYGMKSCGFKIKGGFDIDNTCRFAYEFNNEAPFFFKDIREVTKKDINPLYEKGSVRILAGCAPCQPFSSYSNNKKKDPNKYDLLYEFGRLVKEVKPDIVTMENVPAIRTFKLKNVLGDFLKILRDNGYGEPSVNIVYCPQFGIPQTRKRLVLLASRFGEIHLIPPFIKDSSKFVTVRQTIGNLSPLKAGESSVTDPLHRAARLSPINLKRIQSTREGGSWKDWPDDLKLSCHLSESGKTFGSVYGRMRWDAPSPTITTECTGLGNGRFGHPEQDRAISAREAALLQTFPMSYKFFENESSVSLTKASRYIGNAVPPKLGEVIAESIINHLNEHFEK
jgi:DNA (cytosine-5)-methyltransferase 1